MEEASPESDDEYDNNDKGMVVKGLDLLLP